MQLIVLLTHHFNDIFLNTLLKLNDSVNTDYKIIVLFDNQKEYDKTIEDTLKNIKIIKVDLIKTTYDRLGHSMYIHYFRNNYNEIKSYKYIWIIENDVYYPNSFIEFINMHNMYNYDLMVPEYGVRTRRWPWTNRLKGFSKKYNVGVLAVIMRFSPILLSILIDTIDKTYSGYLESILPHICMERGLSIQQFLPQTIGNVTTKNNPYMTLIKKDITHGTKHYTEPKIYHPIKSHTSV
uniref:Glycosyltransferase 2-like domain-containing protein n=1 Tax=viral metagenome TaxID=1070528 RepID=A0A6C0K017_9ZZZZ